MSDNKDKLSFNVGGEIFDIPTEKKDAFLSKYPDAVQVESFVVEKDTFDIPIEKVDKFKAKYSNAKPLFGDVKKKEQTEPTQAAPLLGLGGVSEEPTLSPSVGQLDIRTGTGALASIEPTPERKALSDYEKNQKALSDIDKQIASIGSSATAVGATGMPMMRRDVSSDELKSQRDRIRSKSDSLIPEARKITDEIVSSEISDGKYREFLTEDGTAVDPTKVGDLAREKALEYGLPDDGYFFDLVRNSIESNVESNRIKERVDKNFNDIMQEKHGMGVDDYVKSVVEKSADATGITKLVGERDLAIANVYDNISTLAKNEVEKIQVDRYGKTAEEYASDIRRQYESQISAVNERYSGLMVDGQFTGTQQQFEAYKSDFESISNAAQEQIDQIVSQEIKDVAAVNAKYDLRYKRQADEIARMYADKIDEKAKLVDPIIKKEIESAYKSAVGKVYEDENKGKKASEFYNAYSSFGPGAAIASFVAKPFTKSILDQTSTYLRAAGLQELSETAKLYAKSVDIGEFKLDNADDFLDPLNVLGATGQTIGGMVPTLVPSVAVGFATGGIGWLPTLAAGATGFAVESVGIAQDAYDDRFAATGSVSEAEEARDKAWKAQTLILPAYALDNFPIFGKIAGGTAKRIALGALGEYGTELLQEYPQNVFEEVIRNDENLSEAMKYVSFDGFKKTASNLTPVLLIGAGGQARQISAENNIKNAAATLSAKMNIGNMTDSSLEQYMLYLTASKGSDFALAFVDAQLRTGNIAEDVAEKSTNAINNSKSFIDKTRNFKISNESKLALASFNLKIRNAKERIESETDPMLKSVEETKLKQLEKQASELATTGTTDYAVVAFKNNTFEILTPQEFEVMSNNENFISSFSNGDIKVEMFGNNQKQMSELQEKAKAMEPEAAPTETPSEVVAEKVEEASEQEVVEPTEMVAEETVPKKDVRRKEAEEKRAKIIESKRKADDAVKAKEDEIRQIENEKKDALSDTGIKKPSRGQDKVYLSAPSGDGTFSRTYETKEQANLSFFELVKTGEKTADIYTIDNESIQKRLVNTSYVEDWAESDNDSNGTTSIEVLQPAKAVLDGDVWRITEKMKIHFKNGSPKKYDVGVSDTKSDIKSDYNSKIEKAKQELTELKKQRDAIQEQAAGKVPVQPGVKAGEKVEEGVPKAEPEKPTEKGKEEVSEEEKVKAAKENLNNVWENWKQSQKNLGVAFDPKSKANEDMELLEAFLTYIKALGVKTAKDIQKAFNDFTSGEATLDDAGAKFVAEKVKPKKGETNYEKTEDMNRKDLDKRGKSLFNAAKKLFMDIRRTFVKFSSDTRELLKSTTDIRPVYDYFVARLGSPGNANLIFQDAKKKIYEGVFPNLRRHLDSLIKYRRIITINESRVESNRNGINSLKASEMFEKAGDEAVNAFNEAVSVANDYANSTEQQALDARGIRNEALRSLRQSEWYRSLSEVKQKRFEKQFREDLGFLKNENFTGKDSNGNPIGLSVSREMLSEIESVVGEKDFNKINERADAYFNEFRKMLEKDLKKGIISQEQYDAMIGKDYSPRVFIQHMFGFDGEFIENIDDARLMKEYSLSSDAIRTLREGLKDLNTDEAYWELITDSEKLLAGYISSRERRYAFNDLNRKMVDVLSKLESEFNELKKKKKFTKEERLRYKKLGNILDAFSTKRKRGMSSANYYENGEKKSFYIRDDIFKQWYDMRSTVKPDSPAIKLLDNLLQTPQRILQSFATGEAAPFFFIFNTARDFIQLSVISDVYGNWTLTPISMAKAIKDFAKGVSHIYKDDALYREAMENGVGMDFLYMEKGLGLRKMMKDSLLKLAEKSDITRAGSMALIKGLDAMSTGLTAANRYSELGFRMAIYERVRDAEYKKIEEAKGEMTNEEYLEAQKDARKKASAVSRDFMNFSEGGSFTKKVNPYASYLNAAVIGTDTVVKEFRKNPPAFTFRVAQGTTILSTAMLGMGLMMLNMFDEDEEEEGDGKDKKYGTLKKYYKILDSINPYYRNKFYIIPTGKRDENGNYEVIRIAKNPALIPISYAAEKALRYNLEKQLLGSEERYSSENLEKDALEINYLFHEYVMPINLSPVDENGKIQDTGVILSSLVQKNIPLSLMMITMTGYDPYTNRYISPEKKYQSELDSKYLIGWNDPEIQGFYKDMAMELNTSITPKEMKVMVEKVITRPENNPIIASVYSMLDRNNKTSDIIKKDRSLVSDILNMTKKVAVISADYEEYAKKPKTKKIEQKIREHKEEKYATSKITKTVVDDIIKKVKNKEIDALDTDALVSEMDKMVSTQIDVFKEANVEISEKDEMEIRHKVYRNAVPALNLPELPTQYKLTYVVDRDPVVMAYRFFEDFGDVDVQGDQFKEISAQMMNEYRGQYNSVMSKDKFNKFLTKYIEAKNDPELIGD